MYYWEWIVKIMFYGSLNTEIILVWSTCYWNKSHFRKTFFFAFWIETYTMSAQSHSEVKKINPPKLMVLQCKYYREVPVYSLHFLLCGVWGSSCLHLTQPLENRQGLHPLLQWILALWEWNTKLKMKCSLRMIPDERSWKYSVPLKKLWNSSTFPEIADPLRVP